MWHVIGSIPEDSAIVAAAKRVSCQDRRKTPIVVIIQFIKSLLNLSDILKCNYEILFFPISTKSSNMVYGNK